MSSPYMPGYEGWEVFDALPAEIRQAHNIVWTGRPVYTNQFRTNLCLNNLSKETALAIIDLDNGKHTLAAKDIGAEEIFY